ncbi:UNVERIFIED_CONTAM: putative WRKY transcription factor 7 [Sesamum radiatum]|uniref:WRKY transcription factor 7 n=1 Tax=Sesamum radiatum TaxID=300843 RepID=A0AAW2RDE0_SESRA
MAVDLIMNYRTNSFEEGTAAEEAASGLQTVEKLIRLLSSSDDGQRKSAAEMETDYVAVADAAVNKFKRVISLLGRTRTGHARFRRAPVAASPPPSSSSLPILYFPTLVPITLLKSTARLQFNKSLLPITIISWWRI